MARGGSDNLGCFGAFCFVAVFAMVLSTLARVWVLLAFVAIGCFIGAYAYRKKVAEMHAPPERVETYYSQKCPNCGAQVPVGEHSRNAHCPYCNTVTEADREPLAWPVEPRDPEEEQRERNRFKMLVVAGIVCAVLAAFGFAYASESASTSSSHDIASQVTSSRR